MAKFIKSVLHAGQTYHSPDRQVVVTRDRLKHWAGEFSRLKSAGYDVPIDWDHASETANLQPVAMSDRSKRRSAKNTVGELADFKVAADGNSAELTLEVSDTRGAEQAESNRVYVSPVILDAWKDGAGNEYSDVITHVDFVNHPVDHSQGPFKKLPEHQPGAVALAIRMGLSAPCVRMSDDDSFPPKKDGDNADAKTDDDSKADDTNPDMPKDGESDDEKRFESVIAYLSKQGIGLPSDTDKTNFVERLQTALMTLEASQMKADSDKAKDEEDDDDEPPAGETTVADPGYAAMSLYAENMHRDNIKGQLNKLLEAGRCTPAEAKQYGESLTTIKLSVDPTGKQLSKSDVETFIAHRESVPQGTFWDDKTRTTKMAASVVEPGARMQLEPSEEDAEKIVDQMFGRKPAAA